MNTLLVTGEFPPFKGGVANYYGHLAASWPVGERLSVLDNGAEEIISSARFLPWLRAIKAVRERIRRDEVEYVLVGQVLPLGTAVWFLSLFQPLRYGVFFHGMDLSYSLRRWHKRVLARLIVRRADKIICANSYVKKQLDKYYPDGSIKAMIVNPGIPEEVIKPRPELMDHLRLNYGLGTSDKISLLTVGRLVKRKGVDKVIASLSGLPAELLEKIVYYVAGAGPEEEYLKAAVPAQLKDKIIFLGEVNDEEKWAWLSLCDIFIMPARDIKGDYEGFGIVYLEANLCGRPVIAGLSGGVSDAVEDGYNGLMADPESEDSIRQAIIKLALNPDLRVELGENGRKRALQQFNWPNLAAELSQAIKK